jgi:hypothetical protein
MLTQRVWRLAYWACGGAWNILRASLTCRGQGSNPDQEITDTSNWMVPVVTCLLLYPSVIGSPITLTRTGRFRSAPAHRRRITAVDSSLVRSVRTSCARGVPWCCQLMPRKVNAWSLLVVPANLDVRCF